MTCQYWYYLHYFMETCIHRHFIKMCKISYKASISCTYPVVYNYIEANEPPLDLRRVKLLLQHIVKLKYDPNKPAFRCVFYPQCDLYDKYKNSIKSVGLRILKNIYGIQLYLWALSNYQHF